MHYRKIWEKANGKIPIDVDGRKYEIHHKDGNRENNELNNLECLTIDDHFEIHLKQGDYNAAKLISDRKNILLTESERITLNKKISEHQRGKPKPKYICKFCQRIVGGGAGLFKHERSCAENPNRVYTPNLKNRKPHPSISIALKGVPKSKQHREALSKACKGVKHKSVLDTKNYKKPKPRIECPNCHLVGGNPQMQRWHFDNCKFKKHA